MERDKGDPPSPDPDARNVLEPDCSRCPSLVESRTCISWGNGPPDADAVVIGEAPGAGDPDADVWGGGNHTGLAYTSRHSGRAIRRLLTGLGVDAYYTNAVKCFPADADDPTTNREPTAEELATCRAHLETELRAIRPAAVVATGKHATQSVLALDAAKAGADGRSGERAEEQAGERADERDADPLRDGFLDAVLEPIPLRSVDATLVPLLHPSYQAVWLSRLGYEPAEYRREVAARLADCGVDVARPDGN